MKNGFHLSIINKGIIMENTYTLYWMDGGKTTIIGKTIQEAFTNAGYGGGAVHGLDFYSEGMCDEYYRDKEKKMWVKYSPLYVHADNFSTDGFISREEFLTYLEKHHTVNIQMKDKSEYSIRYGYSLINLGWVHYIEICFGEYNEGSYFEDGSEDYHFMATGLQYFDPKNPKLAVDVFYERFKNDPTTAFGESLSLAKLYEIQH